MYNSKEIYNSYSYKILNMIENKCFVPEFIYLLLSLKICTLGVMFSEYGFYLHL